jgi:hypothetical protein
MTSTLSTSPLIDTAFKLPNARAQRSLKRIRILQALQQWAIMRDYALALRGREGHTATARRWAEMARQEWSVIRKWLYA